MEFSFTFNILFVDFYLFFSVSLLVPNKEFFRLVMLTFLSDLSYIVVKVGFFFFFFFFFFISCLLLCRL
jgi:hypothetical protein